MSEVHISCTNCMQFIKIDLSDRTQNQPIVCPHCLSCHPEASQALHNALNKYDQD